MCVLIVHILECLIIFLVWLELGRTAKNSRKQKRTIRRWRLDKFGDDVVRKKSWKPTFERRLIFGCAFRRLFALCNHI